MLFRAPGKKLYAITPDLADTELLLANCTLALRAGIAALQYRNKAASTASRQLQARQLKQLCQRFDTPLIINDDWQLAAQIDAAGAHLGREDGALAEARHQFSGILGVSCYDDLDGALRAEQAGADYVAFGSFFPSSVKPHAVSAPLELLAKARAALTIPIVAIGGITLNNAASVRRAGADAVAVISDLFNADDIGATVAAFNQLLEKSSKHVQSESV